MGSINGFSSGHLPFRLSLQEAQTLMNSADGMQPYANADWKTFPQRSENTWGIGFSDSYEFTAGIKGQQDGVLSFEEKNLAAQQLTWDRTEGPNYHNNPSADSTAKAGNNPNSNPISASKAKNAQNFLGQVFWSMPGVGPSEQPGMIRQGLDRDNDGQFTMNDVQALARLDGDPDLTEKDFDKAFDEYHTAKWDKIRQDAAAQRTP